MKTTLISNISIGEICDGFVYNELENKGLYGMAGRLTSELICFSQNHVQIL